MLARLGVILVLVLCAWPVVAEAGDCSIEATCAVESPLCDQLGPDRCGALHEVTGDPLSLLP